MATTTRTLIRRLRRWRRWARPPDLGLTPPQPPRRDHPCGEHRHPCRWHRRHRRRRCRRLHRRAARRAPRLDRFVVDPHVLDRIDLPGDGLAHEDDPRRLRAVEVAVVPQRPGQERVAVAVDLEDGADDAADGLHLVPHLVPRALGLPRRLGLSLLGPDEEEVAEDPDRHERKERDQRIRFRGGGGDHEVEKRRGWCHGDPLDLKRLRSATLVPGFLLSRALRGRHHRHRQPGLSPRRHPGGRARRRSPAGEVRQRARARCGGRAQRTALASRRE